MYNLTLYSTRAATEQCVNVMSSETSHFAYNDMPHVLNRYYLIPTIYTCFKIIIAFYYLELDAMINKVQSKPMKRNCSLCIVERCEVNRSIIVSNITKEAFCSEDSLETYFEGGRAGGGDIDDIKMLSHNKAIITFKDPAG